MLVVFMAVTLSVSIFLARARKKRRRGESYLGFFFRDLSRKRKKKRRKTKNPHHEPDSKQHQPPGATDVACNGNDKSWLHVVKACYFCKELKKVGDGGTVEVARCCAGKVCKHGMHSSCWEERGGDPLPLDDKGKSVFWSCADLDADILPWKSRCKTLLPVPGVGRA